MIRRLITALWAALACFHVYLLVCQAVDGRLLDGGVLLRWCLAFGLSAGFLGLRRTGAAPWGPRALAPWLLAALLHGPAVLDRTGVQMPAVPQAVALAAGTAAALGVSLGVLALGLARLRRWTARPSAWVPLVAHGDLAPLSRWAGPVRAARPPPLA